MQPRKPLHGPLPKPESGKNKINPILSYDALHILNTNKISTKNIAMKTVRAGRLPETMWITEVVWESSLAQAVWRSSRCGSPTRRGTWWHTAGYIALHNLSVYWNWWWYLFEGDSNHDRNSNDSRGFDGVLGNFLLLSHCLPNLADAYWCCEFSDLNMNFHLTYCNDHELFRSLPMCADQGGWKPL